MAEDARRSSTPENAKKKVSFSEKEKESFEFNDDSDKEEENEDASSTQKPDSNSLVSEEVERKESDRPLESCNSASQELKIIPLTYENNRNEKVIEKLKDTPNENQSEKLADEGMYELHC